MTIFAGDIKLVESKVMDDVPEGGGGPTSRLVVDGQSNNIFQDISEFDRAGGKVSLRKLHVSVQTDNTDTYLGSNIIVAEPPNDPNVSVTVFSTRSTFDTRDEAKDRIESYLVRGPAWNGFLFERHVAGQRSIQICQRPNTGTPPIGRTLCLISGEDTPDEYLQYVRVTRVESENRLFYDTDTNADFSAMIVTCEISDALRFDFLGSNAFRTFQAGADRTVLRDTTVADAAVYTGVVPLKNAASIGDLSVGAVGIYTQLVPSSRTEAITLDAKPAAQRTLKLATTPRLIEVGLTPHSKRQRVGQENRSFSWVAMLRPLPAPETVVVSFRALGTWYTLVDDGLGILTGSGVGTVNYQTGSISLTLPALPDVGSSIIFSWGESTAFTDRAANLGFRAPEFAWALPHQGIKADSVTVEWLSGGVLRSVTDNSTGVLSGDGTGQVNYAAGKVFLRPAYMIDAGGEFSTEYSYSSTTKVNVPAPALDAAGFGIITLDEVPYPGTVLVRWMTVRTVSSTSGSSEINSSALAPPLPPTAPVPVGGGADGSGTVVVITPRQPLLGLYTTGPSSVVGGGWVSLIFRGLSADNPPGAYSAVVVRTTAHPLLVDVTGKTGIVPVELTDAPAPYRQADMLLNISPTSPMGSFYVMMLRPDGSTAAISESFSVVLTSPPPVTAPPVVPPPAAIKVRDPVLGTYMSRGIYAAGTYTDPQYPTEVFKVTVAVGTLHRDGFGYYYDPPDRTDAVWTVAERSSGKLMMSLNGVMTNYNVHGLESPYSIILPRTSYVAGQASSA
ncbi:MAG: hypothetical protein JWP93_278 [Polaromonas sp.]|nr:hypothetical protein [Polaromonas sp.]